MATNPADALSGGGQQYTQAQLEQAFVDAGGPPEWAATMAAVAMVESGGRTNNPNAQSGAAGPWQTLMSAQSQAFQAKYGSYDLNNLQQAAEVAVAQLAGGAGISNWTADPVGAAAVANGSKPLSAQQLSSVPSATLDSAVTTPGANGVTAGPTNLAPPMAGVDTKNFHGYDLSAFTGGDSKYLGEAEQAILKFIANPQLESLVVGRSPTDNAEYGYSSFSLKIPQLNAVMITAALAPNGNFDENTLQGIISNTDWYKQTDQNQRTYEAALVSDPSSAHDALVQAQDKVLATANQIGVTLTKTQLDQIASVYAAQSYTPTNILGSESGTSQEWLDQAVTNTVLNVKGTGSVVPGGTAQQYDYAGGTTDVSAATNPTDLTGVMQSLYQGLLGAAQNYLLYNPSNPNASLLTTQDIMGDVDQAMKQYTGTGASGQISQFVNGQVAQYTEQYKQQASSLYPTLAPVIAAGTTPQSYITPLTNYVGSQLGMAQGQINVLDPQWNWIISSPGQNGVLGPVTQDQALQKITNPNFSWKDPNGQQMTYLQTNNGQQIQNQFAQQFASAFGKSA